MSTKNDFCITWDFMKNTVSKVTITDSKETAKKIIDNDPSFYMYYPENTDEESNIYLLMSESVTDLALPSDLPVRNASIYAAVENLK